MRAMLLALPLLCCACTPTMQDDIDYAIYKERQRWNAVDRGQSLRDFFEVERLYTTYEARERAADEQACFHPRSQDRVTLQDGVSDQFDYRWCVLTPYAADNGGQRLHDRGG